ncbi:MAG: hypothetical protein ACOY5F_14520 [Pseudomonadota bacterium]
MTVASDTNRSGPYTGNGVTTIFAYEFRILDKAHLKVVRTEGGVETVIAVDTDYIVSGVGDEGGGQIATVVAPTATQTITMLRNVPFTQEIDLENQGAYFAETVEAGFDLAVMRDQQMSERIDRSTEIVDESAANIADVLNSISALTDFADIYQGPLAVAPTLRKDGSPLQQGDMYFDTTVHQLKVWSGTIWLGPGVGDMLGSNNLSDVADPAASWRNIGGLDLTTVVGLNASSTLTSAAFGKLHFLTGGANFTTTLPTPVGNTGKLIAFLVGKAANASKLYTITTPAGVIGRSGASIVMWANESVLLRSNGTDWEVVQAKQIPFVGKLQRVTDQAGGAGVNVQFTSALDDPTGLNLCYDSTNKRFVAPRGGVFLFHGYVYQTQVSGSSAQGWVSNSAAGQLSGVFSWTGAVNAATIYGSSKQVCTAGQAVSFAASGNGTSCTIAASQAFAYLEYTEIAPSW